MKQILFFVFSLVGLSVMGQSKYCDSLLEQEITFFKDGSVRDRVNVYNALIPLTQCGIDTVDAQLMFKGPFYSAYMTRLTNATDVYQLTYRDALAVAMKIKEKEGYSEVFDTMALAEQMSKKQATYEAWGKDYATFIELGTSDEVLNQVSLFLQENPNPGLTYLELLKKLKGSK